MGKPSGQQMRILKQLAEQQGPADYKELAEKADIGVAVYRAQLGKLGDLVEVEAEGSNNWTITDDGMAVVLEAGGTKLTRRDVGLTDRQQFMAMGSALGGIAEPKLEVITNTIFQYDYENLDIVWDQFVQLGIPLDVRRPWWASWQAHLKGAGKPGEASSFTLAQVTTPDKRTAEQLKESAKAGRNWLIDEDAEGFLEPAQAGEGMGEFTFNEAMVSIREKNKQRRSQQTSTYPQEPASQLLTALAPYLNKQDSSKESAASLITALAPYLKPEAKEGDNEVVKMLLKSKLDELSQGSRKLAFGLEDLPKLSENIKTLAPIIRAMLGVPEHPAAVAQQTPIQLQNPDGTPMIMNLNDFFTVQKFQAEQRREDDSAKAKTNFSNSVQGFLTSIGKAAERAAGAK
jgi:hypothetical protein